MKRDKLVALQRTVEVVRDRPVGHLERCGSRGTVAEPSFDPVEKNGKERGEGSSELFAWGIGRGNAFKQHPSVYRYPFISVDAGARRVILGEDIARYVPIGWFCSNVASLPRC